MPKFRTKPRLVDAFQLTAENYDKPELWPEWMQPYIANIGYDPWAATKYVVGNWLIKVDEGMRVKSPEQFAAEFECFTEDESKQSDSESDR